MIFSRDFSVEISHSGVFCKTSVLQMIETVKLGVLERLVRMGLAKPPL